MKIFQILLIVITNLLVVWPSIAFAIFNVSKAQGIPECEVGQNSYDCAMAIEVKELANGNDRVSRKGETLIIHLENQLVSLTSKQDDTYEGTICYAYLGYDSQLELHIIYVQLYEGDRYLAIHQKSGLQYDLIGYPIPSPTFDFFAAISEDMGAGFSANGFEIWQASGQTFLQMMIIESDWGPRSAMWVSPHQLSIKKVCWGQNESSELIPCGTVIIELKDGVWVMSE